MHTDVKFSNLFQVTWLNFGGTAELHTQATVLMRLMNKEVHFAAATLRTRAAVVT